MIKSIPPKGSIPSNIRAATTIKTSVPRRITVAKQPISVEGFQNKLSWLQEHLAELEQNGADIEIMEDVAASIRGLQELLGILGRGQSK